MHTLYANRGDGRGWFFVGKYADTKELHKAVTRLRDQTYQIRIK
jgi:hypothetical protein